MAFRWPETGRKPEGEGKAMHAIVHALSIAGSMTREITWALILGFALSAVIQAVVRRTVVVRLLGVILALLMGWQFTLAEFTGGPVMIVILVPERAAARIPDSGVSWDYTTWLNIVFLILAAVLIVRFARTGGGMMLRMMGGAPPASTSPLTAGAGSGRARHAMHDMAGSRGTGGAHQVAAAPHPAGSRQSGQAGGQDHAPGQSQRIHSDEKIFNSERGRGFTDHLTGGTVPAAALISLLLAVPVVVLVMVPALRCDRLSARADGHGPACRSASCQPRRPRQRGTEPQVSRGEHGNPAPVPA
jgi:hypothetical protein